MFTLEQITTRDGLLHQGILASPPTPNGKAIVWVHGLTSTFYGNLSLITALAAEADQQQLTFASFNTRGHDMITSIKKIDPADPKGYSYINGGAGYETFAESTYDIDAIIDFLLTKNITQVYLVGHSTGANKACYYASTHDRKELAGVVLVCPMSDRLGNKDQQKIQQKIQQMQTVIERGHGETLIDGVTFFPITPKRYISLFSPDSVEDQFDYGTGSEMKFVRQIVKPLLVILAQNDEYADRPIQNIQAAFDQSIKHNDYQSVIVPEALHNLSGKEAVVAATVIDWINRV